MLFLQHVDFFGGLKASHYITNNEETLCEIERTFCELFSSSYHLVACSSSSSSLEYVSTQLHTIQKLIECGPSASFLTKCPEMRYPHALHCTFWLPPFPYI